MRIRVSTFFLALAVSSVVSTAALPKASAQLSEISFQGFLESSGVPFHGTAQFKFAIRCASRTVWSNDGTSSLGSEPVAAIPLPVEQGVFAVLLGDTFLGMEPLSASAMAGCRAATLQIWVDTGAGFESLGEQRLVSTPFALRAGTADEALSGFRVRGSLDVRDVDDVPTISADGNTGRLSVSSIEFDDGSVQTTAGGGATSDGDWTVAGSNLYSAVSGNVGIGTSSPNQKLHLQTPVGTPVRLALRSGGSWHLLFEQDPESVFSIANGGSKRLAILPNGNVGVGTLTPVARLDVGGDGRVQGALEVGGGLSVTGPLAVNGVPLGSGTYAISPAAFQMASNYLFERSNSALWIDESGRTVKAIAPLQLPDGVTITEFTMGALDADLSYSFTITLERTPIFGGATQVLVTLNSEGQAYTTQILSRTNLNIVVDNEANAYAVVASWRVPSDQTSMQIRPGRIVYAAN